MFHSTVHVHPNCIPALTQAIRLKSSVEFFTTKSYEHLMKNTHYSGCMCVSLECVRAEPRWHWMILSPGSVPHTELLSTNDEASGTIPSCLWDLCFLTRVFTTIVCNVMNSSNVGLSQTSRSHWLLCLPMQ